MQHVCVVKGNETESSRRRFFRRGAELSGGLLAAHQASAAMPDAAPANDVLKTIHSLRSIHGSFSDRRVPDADVETIINASVRAANASNMQSYSIIVSRDSAKIHKVTGYRANCLLLYCADYNRLLDTARHLGHEFHADNMDAFVTSSTNTILAAQTAVIAAKSMGIDSLLTNGIHRGNMERHWDILGLPQTACFPLIALLLGYPKSEPAYRMGRLQGAGVVHYEQYRRPTDADLTEIVRQHDDPSMHLGLNDEWRKKEYKHYLDWFFKEWVTGRTATRAEGPTLKRLKQSKWVDAA
jgi:nitroreductase